MNVTKHEAKIVVPPPTFVIELTRDEAQALWSLLALHNGPFSERLGAALTSAMHGVDLP